MDEKASKADGKALKALEERQRALGAQADLERANRAVFDEARHAHVEQISKAQAELAATLEGHHKRIDAQLADLAAERDAVVAAMAREHMMSVRTHAFAALDRAAELRDRLDGRQAEMAVLLLTMHSEAQTLAVEAFEAQSRRAFARSAHALRLENAKGAMAMELKLQSGRNDEELAVVRDGVGAIQAAWDMEKAQLERALADVDATRSAMLNALKASAAAQVKDHYARLRAQKQRWADSAAAEAEKKAEEAAAKRARKDEAEAMRLARELEGRRRVQHNIEIVLEGDAEWLEAQQAAYTAQAVETAEREIDATDTRSQQALYNLGAHVARGEKEDAQRLSEILVASEGRMQSETLAQQAAATERLDKMKERHDAICVQLGQQHSSRATATAEAAEAAARDVADRTQALLKEAHAARNAARERTRESGLALAASLVERLDKAREKCYDLTARAAAKNTVLLERGSRQRHELLVKFWDSAQKEHEEAVEGMRARALASEAEECAKMREGEKELERESQEVTEAAWAAHEAYIASVEEAEAAITKAAVDAEEAAVKAGSNAAVAWQGWAHEQFTNKQAAGWCRQLIHLAQLHEDTTKGRRDAFDEARERRRADAEGRREKHATEWAEATAELSAKLAELHEFAKGAPARWREAATTCLAEIHERQTKECEESLQKNYAAAWEEEQAAYKLAQELVQAGVDSTRAIGEQMLAAADDPSFYGDPAAYVAATVPEQMAAAQEAAEDLTFYGEDELAILEAEVAREADALLAQKRKEKERLDDEAARRAADIASKETATADAIRIRQLEDEERELVERGPQKLEEQAREHEMHVDLEWDARLQGLQAAGEARMYAQLMAHERAMARYAAIEKRAKKMGQPKGAYLQALARGTLLPQIRELHAEAKEAEAVFDDGVRRMREAEAAEAAVKAAHEAERAAAAQRAADDAAREALWAELMAAPCARERELLEKVANKAANLVQLYEDVDERIAAVTALKREWDDVTMRHAPPDMVAERHSRLRKEEPQPFAELLKARASVQEALAKAEAEDVKEQADLAAVNERFANESIHWRLRTCLVDRMSELSGLLARVDTDGSGEVDRAEFSGLLGELRRSVPEATEGDMDALFADLDPDHSGAINYKEVFLALAKSNKNALRKGLTHETSQVFGTKGHSLLAGQEGAAADATILVLRDALKKQQAKVMSLFKDWDTDGDGTVSRKEFHQAMPLLGFDVPKFQVDNLFDSFDADGSGTIEYDELRKVLQSASTSPSKSPEMRKKSSASPEKQKAMAEKAKALARVQEKSDRAKQSHIERTQKSRSPSTVGGGTPMPSEAGSPVAPRPPPARPSANPTPINGLSPAPRPSAAPGRASRPAPSRASGVPKPKASALPKRR